MKSHLLIVLIFAYLLVVSFEEDVSIDSNLVKESREPDEKKADENVVTDEDVNVKSKSTILFDMAMEILNNSKADKAKAYYIFQEAARLNNSKAQEIVAQAFLFGDNLPLNLPLAIYYFKRIASQGSSTSQMVIFNL